jgi:iron-sulfur cluster repair protein YtfE (RIC family)
VGHNRAMLRDKSLVPLSRQHQHALALCVRINRAVLVNPAELKAWQSEVEQHFALEIQYHFAAEEEHLFPVARRFGELGSLVDELVAEHAKLRDYFSQAKARELDSAQLRQFAETLSAHIRKEERQLFEEMQKYMSEAELAVLGERVVGILASAPEACITPTEESLKTHKA